MFVRWRVKYCVEFLSNCFHFQSARVEFSKKSYMLCTRIRVHAMFCVQPSQPPPFVPTANGNVQQEMRSIRFSPRQINILDTRTHDKFCIDKLISFFFTLFEIEIQYDFSHALLLLLLLPENYSNPNERNSEIKFWNQFFVRSSITNANCCCCFDWII